MPKAFPSMFFFSPGSGIQKEANIRIAQADSNPFNSSMPNFQLNLKFEMKEKKREKRKKRKERKQKESLLLKEKKIQKICGKKTARNQMRKVKSEKIQ